MTVKTNKQFVAPGYGKNVDHLYIGLENGMVADRGYSKPWIPGTYVLNYARIGKSDYYAFNVGIATGDYTNMPTCNQIWPDYGTKSEGITVHPVEWFNTHPIEIHKDDMPANCMFNEMTIASRPDVFESLLSRIGG